MITDLIINFLECLFLGCIGGIGIIFLMGYFTNRQQNKNKRTQKIIDKMGFFK